MEARSENRNAKWTWFKLERIEEVEEGDGQAMSHFRPKGLDE